ncbi:hypothetical protein SPRG_04515 [Saprolegnia parasitica CBS 223.65]|uniref:Uncharacterized protein n=1 Tax=Saprolegnia parasitica (strain CBS 223.65) TaxID=695850 RepID=A0A067CN06_SAPPC|nr:hypothetical protein SPRG_04515 [Saprolegnia parasitica CBS 223.65]KDO30615.1 hypothetical protein SPRG_04515 [Saprolegnia parasitica CBS 223.65]|eukprot:XP_012198826.1 hypothetical protein SPRG_04515 [Saprolegnia parasitica CBS 223.65]
MGKRLIQVHPPAGLSGKRQVATRMAGVCSGPGEATPAATRAHGSEDAKDTGDAWILDRGYYTRSRRNTQTAMAQRQSQAT